MDRQTLDCSLDEVHADNRFKRMKAVIKGNKMASSISDQAYESILEEIVVGNIPAGAAISEHSLAKQLNISRTPVREAIRRLKHEGGRRAVPSLRNRCSVSVCR